MSQADVTFKKMVNDILNYGVSDDGLDVRTVWVDDDGKETPAHTIKRFSIVNRYDLRKEFPAITLRKTAIKSAFKEILWIWQQKSNIVEQLGLNIWDQWKDENGTIGMAYGAQIKEKFLHHKIQCDDTNDTNTKYYETEDLIRKEIYPSFFINVDKENSTLYCSMDTTDAILYDLKHNPYSRRILGHMWNRNDLLAMALTPCCWGIMLDVTPPKKGSKPVLNMTLLQRSSDVITANNWNVCQYALLLMMFAQVSNMIPGELVHVINNAHIYDRHIDIAKELIGRESHNAPSVYLNKTKKNFYEFTVDDLEIRNYTYGDDVKIPVAK